MKKEMIISVLVGLVFGLIIVYGVYTAQSSLNKPNQSSEELGVNPSPDSSAVVNGILVLHSPEDESVVDEPTVTIAGTTNPKSYVVIFIKDEENITMTDEAGRFSVESELELGSNIIEVYALDEDGQTAIAKRTVIYTTKPLVEETK
ncbi:hypothetical protein KJ707_00200 [Patescibacteria group bacterium]|nr:hypothetical protein [Patescibacteria group bacterium]MBU1967479.1 hypothetical protein [Patescibacteria group bacterium]MBU2542978.1 hypothetical protein [Patescibacteria group bacterium]